MKSTIHIIQTHFQPGYWSRGKIAAIALCKYQWGLGEDETATFSENNCIYTCGVAYISGARRWHSGIAGGKQRRPPFRSPFSAKFDGRLPEGLQSLCCSQRAFRLCYELLFARGRPLYHLWLETQCAVPEGCGRDGAAQLSVRLDEVEGQDRQRRLRDRGVEVGAASARTGWRAGQRGVFKRPAPRGVGTLLAEVPCSPGS